MRLNSNFDYSSLFSSMTAKAGGNMSGLYSALGDYSTIKSGTYGKLLNSYYKEVAANKKTAEAAKASEVSKTDTKETEKPKQTKEDILTKVLNASKNASLYNKDASYNVSGKATPLFETEV